MDKPFSPIPITKPELGNAEIAALSAVINSGWIMQGPRIEEFERDFAQYVGAPEAIAVSSGTAALHLALMAAGCGPGSSVLCPSYSFIATANCIRHCGAEPIFVDIEPRYYNIDLQLLAAARRSDTKAILLVHQVGMPAAIDEILDFAKAEDLVVIEDAACALGSTYHGVRIGQPHSLAACFSFHPRKIVTTGDGGMVTTADADFAVQVRRLRQHGAGKEGFVEVGYNFRLTDLQAAIGVEQLKRLPEMLVRRRAQAQRYNETFSQSQWLEIPQEPHNCQGNYQSYQLRLHRDAPVARDKVLQGLAARGITAQPGIQSIHLSKPYQYQAPISLPETEAAAKEVIMLPIYHSLTEQEQDHIIQSIMELIANG